jgi:hypothetical protein
MTGKKEWETENTRKIKVERNSGPASAARTPHSFLL